MQKGGGIRYYESFDKYASDSSLEPFADFVAELEEKRIQHYLSIEFS